ncbi:MAG: class I SAM-dependent methyltransferase [Candidatus Dormibacteria bacterium]
MIRESGSAADFPAWDYQEYPKTLPRDDFWGQCRRTIMGRRMSEVEVGELVAHLRAVLDLGPADVLLDLGCGNGALAARLFDDCTAYTGVDQSAYLIEIAKEYFERPPRYLFIHGDVAELADSVARPESFTKILCFAALQYLPPATVDMVLRAVSDRFPNARRMVLGNLPDRDRAGRFYRDGYAEGDLDEHRSQVGKWWSIDQMGALARNFGWDIATSRMSEDFFNANYRFDAIFTRE